MYVENISESTENKNMSDVEVTNLLKNQLQFNVTTNVFSDSEFKQHFLLVFKTMADILARTLGPYGASTMIDRASDFTVTKDGFNVLQHLRFADTKQNRIRSTLYTISHQMVTKVGDGSTSAVVAAYAFLDTMINSNLKRKDIRPKEWNQIIQNCVDLICAQIERMAIVVNEKNILDVVHNIANIATNENEIYTTMITDIYKNLGTNCTINIMDSDTLEDQVAYEDGVYTSDCYLVDRIYHNKGNECVLRNCDVIMFDHVLESEAFDLLTKAFDSVTYQTGRILIVIAPSYDQNMMDRIRREAERALQTYGSTGKVLHRMVFLKAAQLHKPNYKNMYADVASLFGATVYKPGDTREMIESLENWITKCREAMAQKTVAPDYPQFIIDSFGSHIGKVDHARLGDKTSSFSGFPNKNEALFETLYHDAETALKEEERRALENDAIDNKVFEARTRFSKITCKSATIKVGGVNRLERDMNRDAVDDAVKACASAVKFGYNQGCNLAIVKAIDAIILEEGKNLSENHITILNQISEAFLQVYHRVLANGMSDEEAKEIVNKSLDLKYMCYDMAAKEYDYSRDVVINSCRTDIEILKGAIAMVGLVLTCNQYVSSTLNN